MIGYILRRIAYGFLILLGVNALTFALFLPSTRPTTWRVWPSAGDTSRPKRSKTGRRRTATICRLSITTRRRASKRLPRPFYTRSAPLLTGDLGLSDAGRSINREIAERVGPSLALAVPTFVLGVFVMLVFSLMVVLVRRTKLEWAAVAFAVTVMSVSSLFTSFSDSGFLPKRSGLCPFLVLWTAGAWRSFDSSGGYRHLLATGQRHFAVSRHVP